MDELEKLATVDENFYRVYCLGIPGVLKNKIYNNFIIEDPGKWPWKDMKKDGIKCFGLDFGFNHPMSLCEVIYYNDEFYIMERFYEREKTTDQLKVWMEQNNISHEDYIFADSAEPDRIEMLCTSGVITVDDTTQYIEKFNVLPAKKDVKAGIDYIKSKRIHLSASSFNAIKEYNNYKYKEDKNGVVLEEPVKAFDDFLDSVRYAIYTLNILLGLSPDDDISNGTSFAGMITENNVWSEMGFMEKYL
jgi:phage terminase large subunit